MTKVLRARPRQARTITSMAQDWAADLRAAGKAPRTVQTYVSHVRRYAELHDDDLAALTKTDLRHWLAGLSRDHMPAYCRISYASLRLFCSWLTEQDDITEITASPMDGLRRPAVRPVPVEPYEADEIRTLLATCKRFTFYDRRDEAVIRMLASTGMRLCEIAGITLDKLDTAGQEVLIRGKGGKWRPVPYDDDTAVALRKYLRLRHKFAAEGSTALWVGERGDLTSEGVDDILRRRAKKAGLTGIRAHRFRHSFAIDWMANGGSEVGAMAIAGWSSPAMLARYTAARASENAIAEYRKMRQQAAAQQRLRRA